MRSWYLSRLALERRFEPHPDNQWGVHDRRPSLTMFYARIASGCLAFCAFVFGLSAATLRQPPYQHLTPPQSNYSASSATSQTMYYAYHPQEQPSPLSSPLNGIRVLAADGTELVLQRPHGTLQGTVLMLHGCSHSATDFFPPGEQCPQCIGLPEEIKMTRIALERGYSVISVSSTNRERKCWATHPLATEGMDYDRVATALLEAEARRAYSSHIPLFAVGISSGGLFATSLPLRFRVSGVNSIISSAVCSYWSQDTNPTTSAYPAHVFTHMGVRDKGTAKRVRNAVAKLARFGTQSMEFNVSPRPVTRHYLADAVPRWNGTLVKRIVAKLEEGGHLDENHYLTSDPRHSYWRNSVDHLQDEMGDFLVADESTLSEELNRAWAGHEVTAEYFSRTLDYLEEKLQGAYVSDHQR